MCEEMKESPVERFEQLRRQTQSSKVNIVPFAGGCGPGQFGVFSHPAAKCHIRGGGTLGFVLYKKKLAAY